MIKVNTLENKRIHNTNMGWLNTTHHYSFASWQDYDRIGFGVCRVLNDDYVSKHEGFGMHHHDNFEIISYVIDGELTHRDNLNNEEVLSKYDV